MGYGVDRAVPWRYRKVKARLTADNSKAQKEPQVLRRPQLILGMMKPSSTPAKAKPPP